MYQELQDNVDLNDKSLLGVANFKSILFWIIHNFKFLFIPGYDLKELTERKHQYELKNPKKRRIHRYKKPIFIIGLIIILFLCTLAVFQYWIYSAWDLSVCKLPRNLYWYKPPSPEHPLGTTFCGWDVLGRLIYGTRSVLIFATYSTGMACVIGIFIGAVSGYYGGWLDVLLMRIMDIILSFPGVVFAIIFITIWGTDFTIVVLIYGIIGIPFFARIIRTNVLKEKELPYIDAGKAVGAKNRRILFRHILPNCLQPIIVNVSFNVARNILSLSVLAFLRSGGGWIDWGYDIALMINYIYAAPWAAFFPTLMIFLSVLGFLLLGDSLSEIGLLTSEKL
ncbi:MAG: ABC transporter permease [Promethearchaeota archaeon]|nr:MAG: ABC transporter permease [Candidatus Lokiarchaeota archaeon]